MPNWRFSFFIQKPDYFIEKSANLDTYDIIAPLPLRVPRVDLTKETSILDNQEIVHYAFQH
jgi:hypothetical protein